MEGAKHVYGTQPHVSKKPPALHVTVREGKGVKYTTSSSPQHTHRVAVKSHPLHNTQTHYTQTAPENSYFFGDQLAPQIENKMQDVVQNVVTHHHRYMKKPVLTHTHTPVLTRPRTPTHVETPRSHQDVVFEPAGSPDFISSELEEQRAGISNIQDTNSNGPMIPVQDVSSSVVQLQ